MPAFISDRDIGSVRHGLHKVSAPLLPNALLYDNFNGVDETSPAGRVPPVHPNANTWAVAAGTWAMLNGYAECRFSAASTGILTFDLGVADFEARVTVIFPTTGSSRSAAIMFRRVDVNNYWYVSVSAATGNLGIVEFTGGVSTTRAFVTLGFSANIAYGIHVTCKGDVITASVDGVGTVTYTSSVRNTATIHGLRGANTVTTGGPIKFNDVFFYTAPNTADVVLTVNPTSTVNARTVTSLSLVDNPVDWSYTAGWANAKVDIRKAVGAIKEHIFPFGLLDPWAQGASVPDLNTGVRLAQGMAKLREASSTANVILTLYHGTWWMMDKFYNSVVTPMVSSEAYDDAGRVRYANLPDWLVLVDKSVELAAASPYGCRDFEIWNEGKGYYYSPGSGSTATWDASMHKGDGIDAPVMGYGYFYLRTAQQVVATMTRLGIARNTYRIGGPYTVLTTFPTSSGAIPSSHPLYVYGPTWGYLDKSPVNFTNSFLDNFVNGDIPYNLLDTFLIDCSTYLKFPDNYTPVDADFPSLDPFAYTGKYAPIFQYWKAQLAAKGFAADIPFSIAEIYATPEPDSLQQTAGYADQQGLRAALWADVLRQCYLERIVNPIMWGAHGTNSVNADQGGVVTDPALGASGGLLTKTGVVYQAFKDMFPLNTPLYDVSITGSGIGGIMSATKGILINKTSTTKTVSVSNTVYTLSPYQVLVIDR